MVATSEPIEDAKMRFVTAVDRLLSAADAARIERDRLLVLLNQPSDRRDKAGEAGR